MAGWEEAYQRIKRKLLEIILTILSRELPSPLSFQRLLDALHKVEPWLALRGPEHASLVHQIDPSGVLLDRLIRYRPSVEDIFEVLPPEEALQLLEGEDPEDLISRERLTEVFAEMIGHGVSTLDELARTIQALVGFLEGNEEHLLGRGLPKKPFTRSPFFDDILANLYCTKLPVVLCEIPLEKAASGKTGEEQRLSIALPVSLFRLLDSADIVVAGYTWKRNPLDPTEPECAFEEAPILEGLDVAKATWLEESRRKLLELKTSMLSRLSQALRNQEVAGLREDCLGMIRDALLGDDVRKLAQMDCDYEEKFGKSYNFGQPLSFLTGGIMALLAFVGSCEAELRIRRKTSTRKALDDLVQIDSTGRSRLVVTNYYEILARGHRPAFDEAVDTYRLLAAKEVAFLREYFDQIQSWLGRKLRMESTIRIQWIHTREHEDFLPDLIQRGIKREVRALLGKRESTGRERVTEEVEKRGRPRMSERLKVFFEMAWNEGVDGWDEFAGALKNSEWRWKAYERLDERGIQPMKRMKKEGCLKWADLKKYTELDKEVYRSLRAHLKEHWPERGSEHRCP